MSTPPDNLAPIPEGNTKLTDLLEGRVPHLISSFEGTGQYSQGASSGCGLAALNAVRVVLGREKAGLKGLALLLYLGGKDIIDEIIAICAKWTNQLHLEAIEIARLPLFESCLIFEEEKYQEATINNIDAVLVYLKDISENHIKSSVALVITRPPEIFTVFYIPLTNSVGEGIFAVFDSHPRPASATTGSSFILFSQVEPARQYIFSLMQVDRGLRLEGMGWQGQLLGQYSGLIFSIRDEYNINADASSLIYDANLEILQLRHTVQGLKDTNRELSSEVTTLRDRLEAQLQASLARSKISDSPPSGYSYFPHWFPALGSQPSKGKDKKLDGPKQNAWSASRGRRTGAGSSTSAKANVKDDLTDIDLTDDSRLARIIQEEFDRENEELQDQVTMLIQQSVQGTFECSICFERYPYDSVALVEACEHEMCRECAKGYLDVKLEEGRYPIMCPVCHASKNVKEPGVITRSLVEQLSLSEEQVAIWYQLELSELSIILDCPSCRRSTFVDLKDHTSMKLLTCPLPSCGRSWCKDCSHSVPSADAIHSCDGSAELDNLMRTSGWMYCPGCHTPTEKFTGCNHITCVGKGCNMHYCYKCQQPIVRSAIRNTIETAMREHYSRCQLFNFPAE